MRRGVWPVLLWIGICVVAGSTFVSAQGSGGVGTIGGVGGSCGTDPFGFVGTTGRAFAPGTGALLLSRACNEDHPGSRLCEWTDIFRSIPPVVLDRTVLVAPSFEMKPVPACLNPAGGLRCGQAPLLHPAACCGAILPPPRPSPALITLTPSDPQTIFACSDVFEFTAIAQDEQGAPMEGIGLVFLFPPVVGGTASPGTFSPSFGTSDAEGKVTTILTLNATACDAACVGPDKNCFALVEARALGTQVHSNAVQLLDGIP